MQQGNSLSPFTSRPGGTTAAVDWLMAMERIKATKEMAANFMARVDLEEGLA